MSLSNTSLAKNWGGILISIKTGARSSPLSKAQFDEIVEELGRVSPDIVLHPIWATSPGDRDKNTSLRSLGKTDFFTRDIDQMLLDGEIQAAVHSAKDLPDPMPAGLVIAAMTKGLDCRDCLVFRKGETFQSLKRGAVIATSSQRREEAVLRMRSDLAFVDLRGTIGERLSKLDHREADGVVIAEAAIIRLKLTHLNRIFIPGETTPFQGRLAIVIRSGDEKTREIFSHIDA